MAEREYDAPAEEWRAVVGYEGLYEVSSIGRVRRIVDRRGKPISRLLKPNLTAKYRRVHLASPAGSRTHLIHVLMLLAFRGPRPTPRHQSAHGDGNRYNNRIENLRWATSKENTADKALHGTISPKLRIETVIEMRNMRAAGVAPAEIAIKFRQPIRAVQKAIYFKTWKGVGSPGDWIYPPLPGHVIRAVGERNGSSKLTADEVRRIRAAPNARGIVKRLAREHGVSRVVIWGIRSGRRWTGPEIPDLA